ncbi:unnamed protein product [Thelazia callipaeda]|uniref:Longin domain-containing protein n=1 Tax=Thelazia callipaeda TaxID=103827 RepID=A0A0N5D9K4_THECL|nr:unnamed protein product [Thelazia callipaeda]
MSLLIVYHDIRSIRVCSDCSSHSRIDSDLNVLIRHDLLNRMASQARESFQTILLTESHRRTSLCLLVYNRDVIFFLTALLDGPPSSHVSYNVSTYLPHLQTYFYLRDNSIVPHLAG